MAENTGVTSTEPRHESGSGPGNRSPVKAKNKKWLYLGAAGVGILLLGHKGSQSNSGDSGLSQGQLDSQAQAQTDAALAQDAANANLAPGGVAPTTIEGDNATVTYPSANVTVPQPLTDNVARVDPDAATSLEAADVSLDAAEVAKHAPNEPPKHKKPKPVKKDGKHSHPSKGAKVQGHTGHTVHGKTFPGATGHTNAGSRVVNGQHHQDVKIHYGGHTETHTSVNHGQQWIENKNGANPPGRGPQHTSRPGAQPVPHKGITPKLPPGEHVAPHVGGPSAPDHIVGRAPAKRATPAPVHRPARRR